MSDLRTAAQQALEALEQSETFVPYEGFGMARREAERKHQAAITALKAALAKPCPCGDKPADQCPGEWEPGCDLGNNPKYAKRVDLAEPFALPCPTPKACKAHCCSGHCVLRTNHQNET